MENGADKGWKLLLNIVVIGTIVFTFFMIIKIVLFFTVIPKEIKELNRNIDLPYQFATPLSDYDLASVKLIRGGGCVYFIDELGDSYEFSGYPDVSNKDRFIGYRTTNPAKNVFGISVGDNIHEAKHILRDYGYKGKIEYESDRIYYVKGKVIIYIDGDETVESIQIDIKNTNWLMVQF